MLWGGFEGELELLGEVKVVIALGGFAWEAMLRSVRKMGGEVPKPKPRFGHQAETTLIAPGTDKWTGPEKWMLLGCFHPSPLNTQTGRLSAGMLDDDFARARELAGLGPHG